MFVYISASVGEHFQKRVRNVSVHTPHYHLHHAAVLNIEADDAAHKHHLFVQEQSTQKEVVSLLSSVDLARPFAHTHTEVLRDTLNCVFNGLEWKFSECVGDLRALSMLPDVFPEVLELASRDQVCPDIVSDRNFSLVKFVVILVGADLFFRVHIDLCDCVVESLLDLGCWVGLLALLPVKD